MPVIGQLDLYTQSDGWITIDIQSRPIEVEYPVLDVFTQGQWGQLPVVDIADANTPLEIYTNSGWKGIRRKAFQEVDFFEDNDISEYRYPGGFSTVTSRVSRGNYALRGSGDKSLLSLPGDGLPYYPQEGDTIKFDINVTNTNGPVTFGYATQSIIDGYEVKFQERQNNIEWVETVNGNESILDRGNVNIPNGGWRTCTVEWRSNGMDLWYNGLHLSTSRSGRSTRGIYFRVKSATAFWDYIRAI